MIADRMRRTPRCFRWLAMICAMASMTLHATDIIQTIAGGGSLAGYKPGEANLAMGTTQGVAVSATGQLFVSDTGHHQVLKIDPTTGAITIVAGNGTACYFGDGLPATGAGLNNPGGLAFDSTGNLLIVDRGNFVVRRVDAVTGIISTVAGNGLFTDQVVGTNPPAPLGDGGPATSATFSATMGDICIDGSGNVIVADSGNAVIRRFTIGGTITTIAGAFQNPGFAGDGVAGGALTARFSTPTGVAVDASGNVYIADSGNRRVRKLDTANTVNTVAGSGGGGGGFNGDGGDATAAQIGSLGGLAFDSTGKLLVSCNGAGRIRKLDFSTTPAIITTIAGGGALVIGDLGPATSATLSGPRDVAVDSAGNIFIYDVGNNRVRRVDAATLFIDTVVGTGLRGLIGDRGPKQQGVLVGPQGAAFDAAGNLYIADTGDNAVRLVTPDGTISTYAGNGSTGGLGDGGPAILASISAPSDVAVFGNTLYVADFGHDRIRAIDMTTKIITTYIQLNNPTSMIVDSTGVLYVTTNNQVEKVTAANTSTTYVGSNPMDTLANPLGDGLPAANATLNGPTGLALGPAGELYIADTGNGLIRLISAPPTSTTSTIAGGGSPVFPSVGDGGPALQASLNEPAGVTLDAAGTHLIISDSSNHRIRSLDLATNIITTISGDGTAGFSGDGDVASSARVNLPGKIFTRASSLVFADVNNNRIRQIVSATDIDPKLLAFGAKLSFARDKVTGQIINGKDSVQLKAALALPAGINAANLLVQVDVIDLHQQVQLDANGKQPKVAKPPKAPKVTPEFNFMLETPPPPPVSKFSLGLKGVSVAGAKPTSFSFASKGTFRDQLARAGFVNNDTPKEGLTLPVRVNITLGTTTFTGLTSVNYKAVKDKSGSAKSIKQK